MKSILGNTWKKSLYVAAKMIQIKSIEKNPNFILKKISIFLSKKTDLEQ